MVRGAICLAANPEGEVLINSMLLYNKALHDFQRNPDGHVDLRSFLVNYARIYTRISIEKEWKS